MPVPVSEFPAAFPERSSAAESSLDPASSPLDDLLRAAAECAGAGIDLRDGGGFPITLAAAPACLRCRQVSPIVNLRCLAELRPQLAIGEPHLCPHGQGLMVTTGGRLLVVAPARRTATFAALVHRLLTMADEPPEDAAERSGPGVPHSLDTGALAMTVRSLIAAVDAKDPYTRGHSSRVHVSACALGERLGLDRATINDLYWASILHDVGKIGAPDHILKKPGKLTDEEYRVMKEHPVRGDEMLAPLAWLAGARGGVRHHHERIDGKGYPDGLKDDAIPLIARIIALADTFDAVVSRRAYRNERDSRLALEILKEAAGTQLDRRLVGAFDQHFAQILAILRAAAIPPEGVLAPPEVLADASAREAA